MKKFFEIFGTVLQCFLFLWCVIGLWACAHKIMELEERVDCIQTVTGAVECPENKLHLMAFRCQKMEQDNDMLRLRIEELEEQLASVTNLNHSIDLLALRVTDLEANASNAQTKPVGGKTVAVDDLIPLGE